MSNTINEYTQTDLGNVSPNPKGDYSDAVSYEYLDLVHLDGGSYLCTAELGTTIIGVAPTPGKTTKEWQCVAIPGDITPDYIRLHDEVMKAAEQVGKDASNVAQDKRDVTDEVMKAAVLLTQTQEAAKEADQSKAQAAGYANSAKSSAQTAAAAEESVTKQVTGFDTYVSEQILAAKEAIGQARQDAVGVVSSQGDTSVKEVQAAQSKAQEAIEQDKTAALQDIESTKAAVVGAVEGAGTEATEEIAQEKKEALEAVTTAQTSAVKAVTDAQSTAVGAVQTAQTTATKAVQDAQTEATDAVEKAKQEALEAIGSNETVMQVEKNTEDIADIQGELTALGPAIILSASGPDITVTDSAKRPFVQDKIFGKTAQRTTTGAQLWSGGDITAENILSSTGGYIAPDEFKNFILGLPNGDYYYAVKIQGGTAGSKSGKIGIQNHSSEMIVKATNAFTLTDEIKQNTKDVVIYGNVGSKIVFKDIMLNKGHSPLPWEPYTGGIASPSMDYPQELDTVGVSKNLLNPELYNTTANNGVTFTKNEDGSVTTTGSTTESPAVMYLGEYIDLLDDGETYCISDCKLRVTTTKGDIYMDVITVDKSTMTSIRPYISTETGFNDGGIRYPALYKGDTPQTSWKPYGKDRIVQEVTGRNLLNVVDKETTYLDIKVNSDVITLSRKKGVMQYSQAIYDLGMLEDGQYTVQYDSLIGYFLAGSVVEIRDFINNSILLNLSHNKTKDTGLLKAGKYKILIFSGNTTQDEAMINGLRLTRSEDIPWEPYQSPQQLIIPVDGGLPGIPVKTGGNYTDEDGQQWIANYVDLERGKLIKLVDKEVISGTPNFVESSDAPGRFLCNLFLSTRYLNASFTSMANFAAWKRYAIPVGNQWFFAASDNALYVSPPKDSGITAKTINTMFTEMIASDTPPVIIGQLKTPEEIDLDPEIIAAYKAFHSNYPSTVVSNQDGAW